MRSAALEEDSFQARLIALLDATAAETSPTRNEAIRTLGEKLISQHPSDFELPFDEDNQEFDVILTRVEDDWNKLGDDEQKLGSLNQLISEELESWHLGFRGTRNEQASPGESDSGPFGDI
jgi:hypothetical protein